MRSAFAVWLLLGSAVAACGGEVIDYSPTATRTPFPGTIRIDIVDVPLSAQRSAAELRVADLGDLEARPRASAKLRSLRNWTRAVDGGATSRAEFVEICDQIVQQGIAAPLPTALPGEVAPLISHWRVQEQTAADLCADVLAAPYAHTLRGWADLINERLGFENDQ